jgi:hypothetical protein
MAVTSMLALAPLIRNDIIDTDHIIVDSKIGSSGAGAGSGTAHAMRAGVIRPYKPAKHRHTGEIEQELSQIAGKKIRVSMSPHAVDVVRGILCTNHTFMKKDIEEKEIWKLYQSDDGGVTFKSIGPDFMPSHKLIKDNSKKYNKKKREKITLGVKDILIDPTTPPEGRTLYVAYSTGVYKTVDGGKTWKEQIQFNPENIKDVGRDKYYLKFEMNPKNNLEIYLATYEGLYKTSNGGKLWSRVSPELFGTIKSLTLAKSDPAVIYVVATKGKGKLRYTADSHLWKSTDAGKTWQKIDEQQTQFVTVHPKDKSIVYRALYARDIRYEDTGLFRSKNGGKTWEKLNPHLPMSFKGGFNHKCQIVFDPKNTQHLYVVTWCGVYEGWDREVPR